MTPSKRRFHNTDAGNLIANLRGEVGEIIFTWVLMRHLMAQSSQLASGNPATDMSNRSLRLTYALVDKLEDEIAARLSELSQSRVGRLNFHFASRKLGLPPTPASEFARFIKTSRIKEKRDRYISHKDLPEKWEDYTLLSIPYSTLLRAIAFALRLMKQLDLQFLGPRAKYLWKEMRKKRYDPLYPASASYILLPYLHLSPRDRLRILTEEAASGQDVWERVDTKIDGKDATILASKEWGILNFGNTLLVLDQYPLIELASIDFGEADEPDVHARFNNATRNIPA